MFSSDGNNIPAGKKGVLQRIASVCGREVINIFVFTELLVI